MRLLLGYKRIHKMERNQWMNVPATIPPQGLFLELRDRWRARDGASRQEAMVDLDLCRHRGD